MRQFLFFILTANLLFSCQLKSYESISANKSTSEKSEKPSQLALRVSALKKESGILGCAGVKPALNLFVRTRAAFVDGSLDSLTVAAYANKENPANIPNDLTPNLKKYELFFHELKNRILDLDIDLDGKKFGIEVIANLNGKARKIYDLEIRDEDDGEGGPALNAYLAYRDAGVDLSDVFMACATFPYKK